MNETIIRNHNERVKKNDELFFLGDFCFKNTPGGKHGEGTTTKSEEYINQLNGRIVFVKGNHDGNNSLKTKIERVIIKYGKEKICLVHNPIHIDLSYNFNFVGHVHNRWKYKKINNSVLVNVGVDVWNFRPVTFEEIMRDYNKWLRNNK